MQTHSINQIVTTNDQQQQQQQQQLDKAFENMQVATPNSVISSSTTSSSTPSSIAAAVAAMGGGVGGNGAGLPTDSTMTTRILDHPLYPLLQMVFQKCELATSSPRDAHAETICSSDSFSEDIRNFINEQRARNISLTTGHHEVDRFMLKSIEVLRIHLLELEKVHQLCDNFCQRYITCLKGKMPVDLVQHDETNSSSASRNGQQDGGPSSNNPTPNNNNQNNSSSNNNNNNNNSGGNNNTSSQNGNNGQQQYKEQNNGHHHHDSQQHHQHHHQHHHNHHPDMANGYPASDAAAAAAAAAYHQSYGAYGAAGYPGAPGQNPYAAYAAGTAGMHHYQTTPGDHHSSIKHETKHETSHHRLTASSGSSSASSVKMEHGANGGQYGTETNSAATAPDRQAMLHDDVRSPTGSTGSFMGDASLGSGDGTECEDDDNRGRRQQKKRGIFPKAATNIMRAWLFQHLNHPYPSEDQKKQLAEETGLTILQVNNWFINARRRIVQPMIDQSNRSTNIMTGGPNYSPDATGMGGYQPFGALPGVDTASAMNPLAASHAAMTSAAMGAAYSAASAQHQLSQYGRQQQSHAAMLGLSTPTTGPHMMGAHPALPPPHDYGY